MTALLAAAGLLSGALSGCSVVGDMLPTPGRSATPVPASALGQVTEVTSLRVGDCLREAWEGLDVTASSVPVVACADSHDFEVFGRFSVPGDAFPGDDAVTAAAESGCESRFAEFVLVDYRLSSLDFAYLTPTEQSWGGAGPDVSCLITDPAGPLTGTLSGAAR
ncbi:MULTISPECIES: septum formation family protein [Cryobacterium]|nr:MULTISPECIES: septum formation family protein [Cryobacterium]